MHALRALGEHLERMLAAFSHDREYLVNPLVWAIIVKEIAHGINEVSGGAAPAQRRCDDRVWRAGELAGPHSFSMHPLRHAVVVGRGAHCLDRAAIRMA